MVGGKDKRVRWHSGWSGKRVLENMEGEMGLGKDMGITEGFCIS